MLYITRTPDVARYNLFNKRLDVLMQEWDVLMLSVVTGLIAPLYLWMLSAAVAKRDRPLHRQSAAGLAVILLLLGLWRNVFKHYHTNSQRGDT